MYTHQEERSVEKICYKTSHIDRVIESIDNSLKKYFDKFIMLQAGRTSSEEESKKLNEKFGVENIKVKKNIDITKNFKDIIIESVEDFEKDRKKYKAIFDKESLEEYEDDPQCFKSTVLKNECPIIHSTIHNKRAKELDKFIYEFSIAKSQELLSVVSNLYNFNMV